MFQDDMPDGFPIRVRQFGANGQVTSEQVLQAMDEESIDPAMFEIPDGYTQAALIPVAYTIGTDFKAAARPPVSEITYWDSWKQQS